jgi:uncharacterized protein (DUF885 family)
VHRDQRPDPGPTRWSSGPAPARPAADGLVEEYLAVLRDHEPVTWTRLGASDRDRVLPDRSPAGRAARSRDLAALHARVRQAVEAVGSPTHGHAREDADDLRLLADELEYRRFLLEDRPREATDPTAALDTVSAAVHELLRREELPVGERHRRATAALDRVRALPDFLEQAGRVLGSASAPHLEVALARLPGVMALLAEELPAQAFAVGCGSAEIATAAHRGREGLEAFGALLEELRDEVAAPWRLGPVDHEVTLRAALGTGLTAEEVATRAEARVVEVTDELADLAARGWSVRFPGERVPSDPAERIQRVLDDVADTALPRADLLADARRAIEEARAFSHEFGLVDVPPAERLRVTEVPGYLAGVAVAFISAPPALDPSGGCVYYLSPVPDTWDDERAASFLREYTPAQLRSLALHEGYPGHAVQLEHAAQHPRVVRRLVTRPAFAEGWAVHVEREAVAEGFGGGATSTVRRDDYLLTQRKLELRIATNALLDVGLHAGDLDDAGALELLTGRAFQQKEEAEGKLTRAKVTSGQLCSYFVGGAELADLRDEVQAREGAAFDRRSFHQRVLSHGTPTVDVVRRALADPTAEVRRPFA